MATSFAIGYSSSLGNTSSIHFDPAITFQHRYYYNYKGQDKGKRTEMNRPNYLAGILETTFSKGSISSSYLTEKDRRAIMHLALHGVFKEIIQNDLAWT